MTQGAEEPIPPAVLLDASEEDVINFLNKSHIRSRRFDISNIADLDTLAADKRDAIATKLTNALRKMNPLETDRLHQLLDDLNLRLAQAGASSTSFPLVNIEQRQTPSPCPPEDAVHRQSCDRTKLAQSGGRPIMPMEQLGSASTMTKQSLARAALWLDIPQKHHAAYREVLPLFSKQLEHWCTFQQYWQWGNRGDAGRDKGFAAFLASMRQDYLDKGETEAVADEASFESMARRKWQYELPKQTASASSFESYCGMTEKRLQSHGFTRRFRFSEDPHKQDKWTTWVEYLNYIYWETDRDAALMRSARPKFWRAIGDLLLGKEEEEVQFFETDKVTSLEEQLEGTKKALQKKCARFNRMRRGVEDYVTHEALVHRGQLRAEWALKELALIEKASVKKEEEHPSIADAKDDVKGVDMQGSTTTATTTTTTTTTSGDSINGTPGDNRQLRKRKRKDQDEQRASVTDVNTQNTELAPSPLKRPRTRGDKRSFASSTSATSVTETILKQELGSNQRDQDVTVVTGAAQSVREDPVVTNYGMRRTRGRKPRTTS